MQLVHCPTLNLIQSAQFQLQSATGRHNISKLYTGNRDWRVPVKVFATATPLEQQQKDVRKNVVLENQGNKRTPFGPKSTAEEVTEGLCLDSKVILITGGSSGIGYETSRVLAKRGAHVIIACENLKAARGAKSKILQDIPNAKINVLHLNLGSMYSVRSFVSRLKSMGLPLHVLINNAGIASSYFARSEDGLEMTFAVNHVGHFLLTNLLVDLIDETARKCGTRGRIVIVGSSQHASAAGIDFENLHEKSWMFSVPILQSVHGLSTVYAQSKLANILHAKELARRLQEQGAYVSVNALHPGVFNTSFVQKFAEPAGLAFSWIEPLLKTVEQGAATTCYLAAHPDVDGVSGKYFADCKESSGSKYASDMELARKLWSYTEELIASHAHFED